MDRNVFARNFLGVIAPMTTAELRDFLAKCEKENAGTEGEALMIELMKDELARRAIGSN